MKNNRLIATGESQFGDIGAIRLGLLALSTDLNSETEFHRILPPEVHLFTQRIRNANPVTEENLAAMAEHIGAASELLVTNIDLHHIMYSCTSGTLAIGEERVDALVRQGHPNASSNNPISAIKAALKTLNVGKMHLFTPYSIELHEKFENHYRSQGLEIGQSHCLGLITDSQMSRLEPDALVDIICQHYDDSADCLFISCTALRTLEVLSAIEARLGIPVMSSCQAMLWHALQLCAAPAPMSAQAMDATISAVLGKLQAYGQLFQHRLDAGQTDALDLAPELNTTEVITTELETAEAKTSPLDPLRPLQALETTTESSARKPNLQNPNHGAK